MLQTQCKNCTNTFVIEPADVVFYEKMAVSAPTLCPDCRQQRRLAHSNQLMLYQRKCDITGQNIITNYHADSPYKVYANEYWYSDKWNALTYGRPFDFNRSFFEQFGELSLAVPRPALHRGFFYDDNSPYTNYAGKNRNCHMIFDSDQNEQCLYSFSINSSQNCLDCFRVRKSELCYECIDCVNCYHSVFLQDCEQCLDSAFLKDCVDVRNSLLCVGLRHKEYHVLNKPVTAAEFKLAQQQLFSRVGQQQLLRQFSDLALQFPNKYMHGAHNENVRGDYLRNCKDAINCYDSNDLEKCKNYYQAFDNAKDCMDVLQCGDQAELLYECCYLGYTAYNIRFSMHGLGTSNNFTYCNHCFHASNLFGCIGVHNREQYCILNKQYSEAEYNKLIPRIIAHMKQTGEWGELFPIALSSFAYNESLAQDYFPLTKTAAQAKGYRWRENTIQSNPATYQVPDTFSAVKSDITKELLACSQCQRNYKIIAAELAFFQQANLPLPTQCFYCRHQRRLMLRNPKQLWHRQCMCLPDRQAGTQPDHNHQGRCATEFATTYAPNRKELVYCEQCYNKEIY
ncbi:MAG: zinc-ribbon domain containing protein [Patescibacteria group bacterium]|jgi:hypothetical protein